MLINLNDGWHLKSVLHVIVIAVAPFCVVVMVMSNVACYAEVRCKKIQDENSSLLLQASDVAYVAKGPIVSEWNTTGRRETLVNAPLHSMQCFTGG